MGPFNGLAMTYNGGVYNDGIYNDVDVISPTIISASINGATLTVTWSEALNETDALTPNNFIILPSFDSGSTAVAVGSVVTVTFATPVIAGQTITLDYYEQAGPNTVKDLAGNKAGGVLGFAVTNNTLSIGFIGWGVPF